ncbi:MAG: endonuclease/exonuclease/phosphatase family protein [Candidatus Hydrogenedentes bacterium]|nr:endonuclease/exonuclease/phosphatase family protein [Candidatus Hydrogenedentota bacterium]
MRLTVITLVLVLSIGIATAAAEEVKLTVLSFNVRYGTAKDGENAWEKRKDILVDTIRQANPDIIGTQECLDFQADYIVDKLPEYRWFGVGREADGNGERMAVLYKKDVVSPLDVGNFWLSETPEVPGSLSWNSSCTRMVTWARFYHHASKRFFVHFNTHFDHKSEPARQGAARVLLERIKQLPENTPVIVTGDYNSAAGKSVAWTTLTEGGLADAWLVAAKHSGPTITFGSFGPPKEGEDSRIDWIMLRGPVRADECETITYNKDGRYPSDHFPVRAALTITD